MTTEKQSPEGGPATTFADWAKSVDAMPDLED
jgi:hypothetical protein